MIVQSQLQGDGEIPGSHDSRFKKKRDTWQVRQSYKDVCVYGPNGCGRKGKIELGAHSGFEAGTDGPSDNLEDMDYVDEK